MKNNKRALIIGISGQDGSFLADYLLKKNYSVYGTSRDAQVASFSNLKRLGIYSQVSALTMSLNDFRSVIQVLSDVEPDEIYNLAGQSSVGLSFKLPMETFESVAIGTLNLLEALRFLNFNTRLYNASSSECFGNIGDVPATESTPFKPRSPYAAAKAAAYWQTANYREAYNIFTCSGILFNHESPLRPERFVTRKIIKTVVEIANGTASELKLGNIDIYRDWGWAPEYIEAMWLMLQQDKADDFVIATGKSFSLRDFVAQAFQYFDLNWEDYTKTDPSLLRPTDILLSRADITKARNLLNWEPRFSMPDVVNMMIDAELS